MQRSSPSHQLSQCLPENESSPPSKSVHRPWSALRLYARPGATPRVWDGMEFTSDERTDLTAFRAATATGKWGREGGGGGGEGGKWAQQGCGAPVCAPSWRLGWGRVRGVWGGSPSPHPGLPPPSALATPRWTAAHRRGAATGGRVHRFPRLVSMLDSQSSPSISPSPLMADVLKMAQSLARGEARGSHPRGQRASGHANQAGAPPLRRMSRGQAPTVEPPRTADGEPARQRHVPMPSDCKARRMGHHTRTIALGGGRVCFDTALMLRCCGAHFNGLAGSGSPRGTRDTNTCRGSYRPDAGEQHGARFRSSQRFRAVNPPMAFCPPPPNPPFPCPPAATPAGQKARISGLGGGGCWGQEKRGRGGGGRGGGGARALTGS